MPDRAERARRRHAAAAQVAAQDNVEERGAEPDDTKPTKRRRLDGSDAGVAAEDAVEEKEGVLDGSDAEVAGAGGHDDEDADAGAQDKVVEEIVRDPRLLPAGEETPHEVVLDALRTAELAELVKLLPEAWLQYNKTRLAALAVFGQALARLKRSHRGSEWTGVLRRMNVSEAYARRLRGLAALCDTHPAFVRVTRFRWSAFRDKCAAIKAALDGLRRDSPDVYAAVWMA